MDDMLIIGTNRSVIDSTKRMLKSNFDMKDLGLADVILGIQITRNSSGYILSQSHYIEKVLRKFDPFKSKSVVTPFDPNCKLKKKNDEGVSSLEYSKVIGSFVHNELYKT